MERLSDAGLGLDHDALRLERTSERWIEVGTSLRDQVAADLDGLAADVEQVGSSSVLGLLAKPIIDLAVGIVSEHDIAPISKSLTSDGWIYHGDAGPNGGHIFMLETRPGHRVAHLHVVEFGGTQWVDYLRLREVLRASAGARARYDAVKLRLVDDVDGDRVAYTDGKTDVVRQLLGD